MAVGYTGWVAQQVPVETPNGSNVSEVISNPEQGPIGELLHEFGIPYSDVLGAIITFIIALFVLYTLGRATIVPFVSRLLNRRNLDKHEKTPLLRLTKLVMGFLAIAASLNIAGYGQLLTSLAAIGAAATLAIGFALQDSISNFVAGMFIYIDRPFRIGDWIEWDTGTYAGIVEDITFRVTRVRTFDNELLTVPNSVLTGDVIKNPVAKDELRLQFNFGIGYDDDIEEATDIILEEAEDHPDILDDPAPTVRMTESSESDRGALADSYVGLTSRFWIADPNRGDYLKTRGEYVTAVKNRFDAVGIDMPDPQIDLSGQYGQNPAVRIESVDR
ncbi:putative mechanosensitive ion channel [Halococcus morrhuae DSM 1307]|uniref:Mechanosensitive ion channel family protein n=2 Tax=Halococcus TaxID=2249 RepID=A0AAV3SDB3_HALDO|nr:MULTISPECIES: mechanosensitive ion channel family protein [Halococcus]EMA49385.1 putative mechanosensitive ion channel [Halococcus morrhuae DSM 1307]UOO96170.1 mechanosensitive ion channel family protein [Halococcus dombrowskii]